MGEPILVMMRISLLMPFLMASLGLISDYGNAEIYLAKDGISSNWITSILVEPDKVWVGTTNGISVLDKGSGVWTILNSEKTGGAIPDNRISAIASNDSFIWIATGGGVARYEKGSGTWRKFTRSNSEIPSELVRGLAPDGNNLWIGTVGNGAGLYIASEDKWIRYTWGNTVGALATDYVSYILVDGDLVWFGTVNEGGEGVGGVTLYDKRSRKWRRFDPPPPKGPSDDDTIWILSAKGLIWVGSYGNGGSTCGLSIYDPSKDLWSSHSIIERTSGRSGSLENGERINVMAFDGRRIWIGMGDLRKEGGPGNGAIVVYDTLEGGWYIVKPSSLGLLDERVTAIAIDGDNVWIGTWGGGIGKFARPLDRPKPLNLSSVKVYPDPAGPGHLSISFSLPTKLWTVSRIIVTQEGSEPVALTPYALGDTEWGADYEVIKGKDGRAQVQVWAKDEFGGELLASFDFLVDTTPPPKPRLNPLPVEVNSFSILISGTAEPGSKIEIIDNGKLVGKAETGEDGRFEAWIRLSYGHNTIVARAEDMAGNRSDDSDPIELELVFPAPVLEEIPDLTNSKMLTVKGISAPGTEVEIYVNESGPFQAYTSPDGHFFADIELQEGRNSIKALCRGEDGWERISEPKYIVLDTIPPLLLVQEPEEKAAFAYPACIVSGDVEPGSTLFVNGRSVEVDLTSGHFRAYVELGLGTNVISTIAVDKAGNRTKVEREVRFDPWVEPEIGRLISIPSPTGSNPVEIFIPPDSLVKRARIKLSFFLNMEGARMVVEIGFVGDDGTIGTIWLRSPMEIRFRRISEPDLYPAFWDGFRWRRVPYKADREFLVIRTLSSGRYGLLSGRAGEIGKISLYPNPFSPNGDGVNDILNISCDSSIKRVFVKDLKGRILFSMDGFGSSQIPWDGKDNKGRVIGLGIYICEVETEKGMVSSLLIVAK